MPKDDFVRARTDSYIKQQAEAIFMRLGINMSDAINLFLTQVTLRDGLPFDVTIPPDDTEYRNTKKALHEEHLQRLRADIEQGATDLDEGRFLSAEDSRTRTRARLDEWKSGRKPH